MDQRAGRGPKPTAEDVLREFVADINSTGGLIHNPLIRADAPNADWNWTRLAVTYHKACVVLGVSPVYVSEPGYEDDEESAF